MANDNETFILKLNRYKVIFTGIVLGFVFICFSGFIAYKYMGEIKAQRLRHLKRSVQIARNSIEPILMEYRSQKISRNEALTEIRNRVRLMIYNDHIGKNYIFMSSYDGIMLVQPFEPEKEMSDVWDLKDHYGVYIIRELVKVAQSKDGQGYVSYHYQRPGQAAPQEKISFVIGIPELNCYIGTGQYMGDLRKSQGAYILEIAGLTIILLALLFILVLASMKEIRAQNAMLKKAERELAAIFHNTFQFIGTLSVDGKLTKINQSALDFIEQDEASVIGAPLWETPWWQGNGSTTRLKEAINNCAKGEFCRFNAIHTRPNQDVHDMDTSLTPIFDENGDVSFLLAEARDITEQIKIKNDLVKEMNFSDNLINSLPGLFFLYKQKGDQFFLTKCNYQHKNLLGFSMEELQNVNISMFFREQDLPSMKDAVTRVLKYGRESAEFNIKTKDGGVKPFLLVAQSFKHSDETFIIGTGIELTKQKQAEKETKKLEAMLHQAQKMEAVGTLAGGIAHDFNNILGAILGYAELIKTSLSSADPTMRMQDQIITAALRARDLVKQILLFSRQSEQETKPLQPELIIKEALKLLRSTLPTTIEIKQDIPNGLGTILADPTQIHQIVMNLCTNAYHAMRETGGVIGVSLSEKKISNLEFLFPGFNLKTGSYLFLEISDTGHGMDKAVLEKVFDPYFTTKRVGEGTGLGLSVVHGIVKSCGGEIRIYSEPGQGTNIHIYFPKFETDDQDTSDSGEVILQAGTERILLVDDEPTILEIQQMSIEMLGYKVTAIDDSRKALEEISRNPDNYDLVITDMTMPHMTGFELAKQIFKRVPGMPIVLSTGYSELITKKKAEMAGIKAFIMKPVLREDLSKTIREALDGRW